MKDYVIVELENGNNYVVVDNLKYNNVDYFLTAELLDDKMNVSDKFDIHIYDNNSNTLTRLVDERVEEEIRVLFDERLESNIQEYNILENIDINTLIKMRIVGIDNTLYKLEYDGNIVEKYMYFYSNIVPKINDEIYISKNLIDEKVLSYGYIENLNNLNSDEILILESNGYRVFYRRYYG